MKLKNLDIVIIVLIYLAITHILHQKEIQKQKNIETIQQLYSILPDKFENIGIRFPEVYLAQIIVETGNFTSVIFKECNNVDGMKVSYKRKTTAVGECRGHALYKTKADSVLDYYYFQQYSFPIYESKYGKIRNNEDYLLFLKRVGYAEDKIYTQKLKRWLALIVKYRFEKNILK